MEVENKAKASKIHRTACREGNNFYLLSQNKENGGREQGKGFQIHRFACRDGNNLIFSQNKENGGREQG